MQVLEKDDTLRLIAEENFSITFADALHLKMQDAMRQAEASQVVLDIREVELIDSIGVKLVVGLYKTCLDQKRKFSMEVAHPSVSKVLHLCKLDQMIEIRESNHNE